MPQPPVPAAARRPQEARELLACVGELKAEDLGAALKRYGVKAPDTKNDISDPFPFNLMFKCGAARGAGGRGAAGPGGKGGAMACRGAGGWRSAYMCRSSDGL